MKHKGHREIPDFSSKRVKSSQPQSTQQHAVTPPPPPPVRAMKPQTGSAKSGRRGT
jgi:hypothetical protein